MAGDPPAPGGAIARVREGHGWRERYFFPHGARVGEIAPDIVLIEGRVPLGAGAIVNVGGLLEIRPEGDLVCRRILPAPIE